MAATGDRGGAGDGADADAGGGAAGAGPGGRRPFPPVPSVHLRLDGAWNIRQSPALDRTQPILPLRPGLPEGRTHDYRRHGTTSLYAALEIATGQVLAECHPRHRAEEFLAFLRRIVREFPDGQLHLVVDNSSTHTTPEVKRWLTRHRRVHLHFTPKGASWMNMVESWFSILTRQQVRRGSYSSVKELVAAIERFVASYNERAQPFVWTKPAAAVLTKAVKPHTTSETEH